MWLQSLALFFSFSGYIDQQLLREFSFAPMSLFIYLWNWVASRRGRSLFYSPGLKSQAQLVSDFL